MAKHPPVAVVRDAAQAASLMDPTRVALLERLAEPGSASTVARETIGNIRAVSRLA